MHALESALRTAKRQQYNKTAAARVRAAPECIEEALTSLTALLDNSLIDSPLLATRGGSSQAERSLSEFVGLSFVCVLELSPRY